MADADDLPLCFVLMPFGAKTDASGRPIDFDCLYETVFKVAITGADMEPLRADEERDGGLIHKPMFERLVLAPYALADLTLANANVFYELGVRHAVRPHTTVLLYEKGGQRLPFDVAPLRAIPYEVDDAGEPLDSDAIREAVTERLRAARDPAPDSPIYQLLDGFAPPDIARLKTDVFRERVRYNADVKRRLAIARDDGIDAVRQVRSDLGTLVDKEAGVLVDLLLSLRDVDDFDGMISLVGEMPELVRASVLVREQLAFAHNRVGNGREAESLLETVLDEYGPSSETLGLLGRVYKDRYEASLLNGDQHVSTAYLDRAIATYTRGFESDWRDAYPGVNALTLMTVRGGDEAEIQRLTPVVRYAVERRLATRRPDYWDYASLLELEVLAGEEAPARSALGECLASATADWQRTTTARNLELIANALDARGEDSVSVREMMRGLLP